MNDEQPLQKLGTASAGKEQRASQPARLYPAPSTSCLNATMMISKAPRQRARNPESNHCNDGRNRAPRQPRKETGITTNRRVCTPRQTSCKMWRMMNKAPRERARSQRTIIALNPLHAPATHAILCVGHPKNAIRHDPTSASRVETT